MYGTFNRVYRVVMRRATAAGGTFCSAKKWGGGNCHPCPPLLTPLLEAEKRTFVSHRKNCFGYLYLLGGWTTTECSVVVLNNFCNSIIIVFYVITFQWNIYSFVVMWYKVKPVINHFFIDSSHSFESYYCEKTKKNI